MDAPNWDGSLSIDEFRFAARVLIDRWTTIVNADGLPSWSWVSSSPRSMAAAAASHLHAEEGYLALEKLCLFENSGADERDFNTRGVIGEEINEDGFTDTAMLVESHGLGGLHYYDLHIVYSDSFRVPVLYFRAYDGDGRPLLMEEIKNDLPANSAKELLESKWTFITQEEHPYLYRPWYKLHPCGSSEWMKLLYHGNALSQDRKRVGTQLYLMSWLSVVGPMVGLKIPLDAMKQLTAETESSV